MHIILIDHPDGTTAASCAELVALGVQVHRVDSLPDLTALLGRMRVDMVLAAGVPGLDVGTALMVSRLKQPAAQRVAIGPAPRSRLVDLAHRVLPSDPSPTQLRATSIALAQEGAALPAVLRDVIGGVAGLPSVARVLDELRGVLADDRSGVDDAARIIAGDPGLAAKVLHLANAGFVRHSSSIADLSQTASLLGMRMLREIIVASAAFSAVEHSGADPELVAVAQQHGTAAARAMHARPDMPAHAATGALLIDVGLPLMSLAWAQEHREIRAFCRATSTRLVEEERRRLGATHADAGGQLVRRWSLPYELVDLVAGHHVVPGDTADDRALGFLAHQAAQLGDPGDTDPWEPDLVEDLPDWLRTSLGVPLVDRTW